MSNYSSMKIPPNAEDLIAKGVEVALSEHPATAEVVGSPPDARDDETLGDAAFWNGFIDERVAAKFLSLSERTMQAYRFRGGGPPYVRLSSRCIRYRRLDLLRWAQERTRRSTSDRGEDA